MSCQLLVDDKEKIWIAAYTAEYVMCLLSQVPSKVRRGERIRRHMLRKFGQRQGERMARAVERMVGVRE